jgi:KamA family protein
MQYKSYTLTNFRNMPQASTLAEQQLRDIEIIGSVFPFRVNNYVTDHLIDWDNVPDDPLFVSTFPQRGMLLPKDYQQMSELFDAGADKDAIQQAANAIRLRLNPHPAGQQELNTPRFEGKYLEGVQHKYREALLIFPHQGQNCHAFCTFCFRWPQFTDMDSMKISSNINSDIYGYIRAHPDITDVLFTGGDPLIMRANILAKYIEPLLTEEFSNIKAIRIGTRALSFWPNRFLTDSDSDDLLRLFEKINTPDKHLAIMAHFNHPKELETDEVKQAIARIQETGAVIRTQSPLLRHINAEPRIWVDMWQKQVALNCIPYYMFIARNTGAQHYFSVPLVEAWQIYREAYQSVSGLSRTVRGPSMSALPGKIQITGVEEVSGEKVIGLQMLQGRNPDWVHRPFFAEYDEKAIWYTELKPAFGEKEFFFSEELKQVYTKDKYEDEFE